jgi:hypothetical protein
METTFPSQIYAPAAAPDGAVVTKAAVRAADRLGLSGKDVAAVLGVSEATLSRMRRSEFMLAPASKPYELALLLIRLFRSLDAITGGQEAVAQAWLVNPNTVLQNPPLARMRSITGLMDVIAYLDARRALV